MYTPALKEEATYFTQFFLLIVSGEQYSACERSYIYDIEGTKTDPYDITNSVLQHV